MRFIGDIALDAEVRAIASGAITDGSPVLVNADSTVGNIAGATFTTTNLGSGDSFYRTAMTFDSNSNRIVIAYGDGANSQYGTAVVASVSGGNISFGTPVVFNSAQTGSNVNGITITFDSNSNKVVIAYRDNGNSNYGTAIVGTVDNSDNSISFGSETVFESALAYHLSSTFDTNSNKVVVSYRGANDDGFGVVGTVSGTSISFGTATEFSGNNDVTNTAATFDSSNNKVVIAYTDAGNSNIGTAVVGTVSGTSISFGSVATFSGSNDATFNGITFDTNSNKVVIAYRDESASNVGKAIVGTVSSTSISFGTAVTFRNADSTHMLNSVVFDSSNNKIVIAYYQADHAEVVLGTVSETSISFATHADTGTGDRNSAAYDTTNNKVVIAGRKDALAKVVVRSPAVTLTSENFIGFAHAAYADGQKATIKTTGSIARDIPPVQIADSLGNAVTYDASQDQSIHNTVIYDPDSQKLLIVYFNNPFSGSNRGHAKVVVGTVDSSNNTISLGTPVTFHADSTLPMQTISAAYDTNADRLVVAFADPNDSHKSKAMVGTVSGTSISFGSEVVFDAGDGSETKGTAMAFDSNTNRIVITYGDSNNSDYSTAIVGTVSGTSISFGTAVVFNSSAHSGDKYNDIVFDSNANKLAIFYRDSGASNHGKVRVATVDSSDNSISFGTETSFNAGTTQYMSAAFDSNANKILVLYDDGGNSSYGTGRVGTISGTDISFGTATVFQSSAMYGVASTFNSNTNKITIGARTGSTGIIYDATISGTGVSFSSGFVFNATTTYIQYPRGIAHDANTNKDIILYRATTAGVAAVIVPASEQFLTIGQQYFVQTDGTLGTSADDPSVIAGTAIGTSELIVKG